MKKDTSVNQKQPVLNGIKVIQRKEEKGALNRKAKTSNQPLPLNQEVKCPILT